MTDLPPCAPADEPLSRVRDRLVAWTLRHRLQSHPAVLALADLYDRRIAGDEPTAAEWRSASAAIDLDLDLDPDLARARDLDRGLDRAHAIDLGLDRARDLVALLGPRLVLVEALDRTILAALDASTWRLDMGSYHYHGVCGTTHCRAGSAIVLHPIGRDLEAVFGPWLAGAAIYLRSTGAVPNFFASDDDALADMRRAAGGAS